MKPVLVFAIGVAALLIGFGAGFAVHPTRPSNCPAIAATPVAQSTMMQPTVAQATAAVRRHRVGFATYPDATLTLGECAPGTIAPGVSCMTRIILDPGAKGATPQDRAIGFARVAGQWEVSLW